MTLSSKYAALRDAINDSAGYRILDDDDVIQEGDETTCASLLLSTMFGEDWHRMSRKSEDWRDMIGRTVRDMNDPKHNDEMDVTERLFRRKAKP